ncbi:hypothetical protein M407DRAFT_241336 [Tulasnella calospora MUT 4182]|uniref:thioredoxin-dependent peroxiredoxin n=1 Tax=Tulasnella calospora MUT 4182 TaxID=1051891 RepID=A0A0C3MFY0_9AGAM|nr:hypothetical protein M407DRAFT_241336 [Tulasnella calospora MUT 4182]
MPRKKAEATTDGAAPDAALAEPTAPRRSGRNAGKEKPAPAPPAPKAPRKKRAAKEAEGEGEHKEEPAAKKAKPDSKAAEEPAKPESKAAGSKPASKANGSKPPSKAAAKPASSKGKPASSKAKPASKAGAAAKATEEATKKPDAIPEEKEDVEMADKENQEKAAEAPADAKPDTAKELQVGDTLPDLTLKNEKEEDVKIAELAKEKGVVFFLVPKADTPGCTTQACGFRDNYEEFEKLGYDVYCLSADSPSAQSKWQTKKTLQYHLISDPKRELITALGAGAGGKTKRSHLVFEKGTGKLVEKKLNVKPADSPTQALEFVKNQASA